MTHKLVQAVEMPGIEALKLMHSLRQIRLDRFNEQMIVIAHLAKTRNGGIYPRLKRQSGVLLADGAMHASSGLEIDSEIAAVALAFHVHAR